MSILTSYDEAIGMIAELIYGGRELLAKRPLSKNNHDKWEILAANYLKKIYGPKSDEDEAVFHHTGVRVSSYIKADDEKTLELKRASTLEQQISALEAQHQTLNRFASLKEKNPESHRKNHYPNNQIFIVHGHNEGPKYEVARFLEKQGLEVIILHEMPNRGRAIIEKFEDYSDVGFAVVLLTADDRGGSIKTETLQPRARQNVIFELGYFFGKLGRHRVCALLEAGIENPSDIDGVVYILYDQSEGWKLKLAKELKEAGYPVDLNKG